MRLLVVVCLAVGCAAESPREPADALLADGGRLDAARVDAADAAPPDTGGLDAALSDGPDVAPRLDASDDAPPLDAGVLDAQRGDALDVGPRDARPSDAAPDPDGGALEDAGRARGTCEACVADAQCGPGAYCATFASGGRGCVPACDLAAPACPRGFGCVPAITVGVPASACLPAGSWCCVDEDGDRHGTGIDCRVGGDCDDTDLAVYVGAFEVCDAARVDNDCDGVANDGCTCDEGQTRPCTLPGECTARSETCRDNAWGRCPVAAETCNGLDDDCDGRTDERVNGPYYPDADADGYGTDDPGAIAVYACGPPPGYGMGRYDCDDADPAISPGAFERCTCPAADENCNGSIDEGCSCTCGSVRSCGTDVGECRSGTQVCADGTFGTCVGAVAPVAETCNGLDDDCDATTDEACTTP